MPVKKDPSNLFLSNNSETTKVLPGIACFLTPQNTQIVEQDDLQDCLDILFNESKAIDEKNKLLNDQNNTNTNNIPSDSYSMVQNFYPSLNFYSTDQANTQTKNNSSTTSDDSETEETFENLQDTTNSNQIAQTKLSNFFNNKVSNSIYNVNISVDSCLPKKLDIKLNILPEENKRFKEQQTISEHNKLFLSNLQKKVLEKFGNTFLPKKYQKDLISSMHSQLYKNQQNILRKLTTPIPVSSAVLFVPICYRINSKDSSIERIAKKNKLHEVKFNIILAHYYIRETNTELIQNDTTPFHYIFANTNREKIDSIIKNPLQQPEIFFFIPDFVLDEEGNIIRPMQKLPIKVVFFDKLEYLPDLLYSTYIFSIKDKCYLRRYLSHTDQTADSGNINTFDICNIDFIETFEEFITRAKTKLNTLHNLSFYDNIKVAPYSVVNYNTKIRDQVFGKIRKARKRALEQSSFCYQPVHKASKNFYISELDKFNKIKKCIEKKYIEEKNNGTYNPKRLIQSKAIHNSAFKWFTSIEEKINYMKNIFYDMHQLNINKDFHLTEYPDHSVILLPMQHYAANDQQLQSKIDNLLSAEIEKRNFVYFGQTRKCLRNVMPEKDKMIISLLEPVDCFNTYINDKIFVFLPQTFDHKGKPLTDPHEFSFKKYFYDDVVSYQDVLGYPLYKFHVPQIMYEYEKGKDATLDEYLSKKPDIEKETLEDYVKQSYELFDQRVLDIAKELQKKTKGKL